MDAKNQTIAPDWQDKIELHCVAMEQACAWACAAPTGPECDRQWDFYRETCGGFLNYIEEQFGSDIGFDDFLRADAASKLRPADWPEFPPIEDDGIIGRAGYLTYRYSEFYKKEHVAPQNNNVVYMANYFRAPTP